MSKMENVIAMKTISFSKDSEISQKNSIETFNRNFWLLSIEQNSIKFTFNEFLLSLSVDFLSVLNLCYNFFNLD